MSGRPHAYRFRDEMTPPPAQRVTDTAITRFAGIYEVDPELMREHVRQQSFPNWDTLRIAGGRTDHLHWMHDHWAGTVVSGEEILAAVETDG